MPVCQLTDASLALACDLLRAGGLVAFPTETSYGLAVDPLNQAALERLFSLKRRDPGKPVLLIVAEPGQLAGLAAEIPAAFNSLMARFWPGPLTLVFPGAPGLPALLTGGTGTIGARVSSHPAARRLGKAFGRPLTATSANLSGFPAAVTAEEVTAQLGAGVDLIIDGGETPGGLGSTVVAHRADALCLLRAGVIPFAAITAQADGQEGK